MAAALSQLSAAIAGGVPFRSLFESAGRRYGVPPALLAAIAFQESRFNPNAFNPESGSNPSVGLMQISVPTALALGHRGALAELYNPALSVELAAKLLRDNLARVRSQAPGLPAAELESRAIAAYNAGWSKQRPGDAPRTAGGAFINLAGYVEPVRAYFARLVAALGGPAPAPSSSSSTPVSSSGAGVPSASAEPVAIAPGALIAALLLVGLLVASRARQETTTAAVSG